MNMKRTDSYRTAALALASALAVFIIMLSPAVAAAEFGFLDKWGEYGVGNGEFNLPHDVAIDSSGKAYVSDWGGNRIQKFDSDGAFISQWGSYCRVAEQGLDGCDGKFFQPQGVAIDSNESVYVVGTYNNRIQKFDSNGAFLDKWGEFCNVATEAQNSCDGRFNGPYSAAVDSDGNLIVADTFNNRIQKFDSSGGFVTKWGRYCDVAGQGTGGCDGKFNHPTGITVDENDTVYVADTGNHRMQKFDPDGNLLGRWGSLCRVDEEGQDACDGNFYYPTNIAVGLEGEAFVIDGFNNRIQEFDSNGVFLDKWGSSCDVSVSGSDGCDGQFRYPYGIALANDGSMLVADTYNHRIQRFGQLPGSDEDSHGNSGQWMGPPHENNQSSRRCRQVRAPEALRQRCMSSVHMTTKVK